jgi:uncharacterized protein
MNNVQKSTRRSFIKNSAVTVGFLGLQACAHRSAAMLSPAAASIGPESGAQGYGPLQPDPKKTISLPQGFSYTSFSRTGDRMDDGLAVPGAHDGMATFPGPKGTTLIVRNHELSPGSVKSGPYAKSETAWADMDKSKLYDRGRDELPCIGGTTTLVFDTKSQTLLRHYYSLAGTIRNCSGGPTPWGSWLTCEETVSRADSKLEKDHGYNFDVPATATIGLVDPVPLTAMGRFNHEAVAVDPKSGVVYQTEDRSDGLIYRFIPNKRGDLAKGGILQALAFKGSPSRDTRNWPGSDQATLPIAQDAEVEWITLSDVESPKDDLRQRGFAAGAARFARGEGMFYGNGEVYFACTNGGAKQMGQIFRYAPSRYEGTSREAQGPAKLELFIESHDLALMKSCDNLTIAPWGDVIICEDAGSSSRIVGVSPSGKLYTIGHTEIASELAGSCFSPDGTTLFVNLQQRPGQTLAITGPWKTRVD